MARPNLFAIDGHEYINLPITSYQPYYSVVDGEGTDRMQAEGFPMFRDPAGTFINLQITLGGAVIDGQEEEFKKLVKVLKSYGRDQFHSISHLDPDDGIITQNMYCTSTKFDLQRVTRWGEMYWKPLSLSFVAEKAYFV